HSRSALCKCRANHLSGPALPTGSAPDQIEQQEGYKQVDNNVQVVFQGAFGIILPKGCHTETSPGSSAGAFLALLSRFPSLVRAGGLLCRSAWTLRQTRSVSGDT